MLELTLFHIRVRIGLWFPAMVIVMLSLGDAAFSLQCLVASFLHECGHFIAMLCLNDRPSRVYFGAFGVRVERAREEQTGYRSQALISLAGPCTNLLCAAVLYAANGLTSMMLIHAVLGGFNLLPVTGMDGGEALYRLLCLFACENTAHKVCLFLSILILLPLAALGFYVLLHTRGNPSLRILSTYLILLLIFKEKH